MADFIVVFEPNGWAVESGFHVLRINGWLTGIVSSAAAFGPDMWDAQVLSPGTAYTKNGGLVGPFTLEAAKKYVENELGMSVEVMKERQE